MKRPASAMAAITVLPKYPGLDKKRAAIHYKESTVYTVGKPFGWRVKPCYGSRRTKYFTVGSGTKPEVVWEEVVKHLKALNA